MNYRHVVEVVVFSNKSHEPGWVQFHVAQAIGDYVNEQKIDLGGISAECTSSEPVLIEEAPATGYKAVALRTTDAYSFDRYGQDAWLACAKYMSEKLGLDDLQIEAVLRSKYMRWTVDNTASGRGSLAAFKNWFAENPRLFDAAEIDGLIKSTFPESVE